MGRTVIIAQARMSSTRLPGKTLMDLGGKPVVNHVVERARASRLADDVWIATTTDSTDDVLVAHLEAAGMPCMRGSLDDVLARYVQAAEASSADTIVRVTCDCPLIDPDAIDAVIAGFRQGPLVDYCSNGLRRTYPIGMDAEVFSREALKRAHTEAAQQHEREHVTPYMYQHPDSFRLRNVDAPPWAVWPELRLTLDDARDLVLLQKVVEELPAGAGLEDIIGLLSARPDLVKLNADVRHRHVQKPAAW